MKKSIVIGANSFIGRCLIEELKNTTYVTGVYHNNKDKFVEGITYIPISDLETGGTDYDDVYLLSAAIHTGTDLNRERRNELYKVNVDQVAAICQQFPHSKIIYSSSVSVYLPSDSLITEKSATGGLNEYGVSKYWGEKIVEKAQRYAIVRFPSVYGPGMKLNTIIPIYINQALRNREIVVWGEGNRLQNYIHAKDAAGYLIAAAAHRHNDVFLASSRENISNRSLAEKIANITNSHLAFTGNDLAASFSYCNAYSREKLSYKEVLPLEEGLKQTIKWIEKGL